MSVHQEKLPYPNASYKTFDLPSPQQWPEFRALVHDLRREYRIQFPDQEPGEDVEFFLYTGPDGRSGYFEARTERQEGDWTIHRHVVVEIEDNRAIRRREIEIPATAFWAS